MPIIQATCEYKKVRGCSIKADVYLPEIKNPAVLLFLHGGALISGSRKYLRAYQINRFKQAGFAVVSVDYRLAPETRLEAILEDIQDAMRWIKKEGSRVFGFDANRISVVGGSAGGYLSLMCGTFPEKPRAIVSFYGYGDILGDWYTTPSAYYCRIKPAISKEAALASVGKRELSKGSARRFQFYFYCRQQGIWPEAVSRYHLPEDQEKLKTFCPVHRIARAYPPTLLLHGDQDTDVPCEQSIQMSQALTAQGIENQLIVIEARGHMFDYDPKDPKARHAVEQAVAFLAEKG